MHFCKNFEVNAQFTVSFNYTKLLSTKFQETFHGIEPVTFCFTVERLANCAKLELVEGALGLLSADAKPVVVVFAANSGNPTRSPLFR